MAQERYLGRLAEESFAFKQLSWVIPNVLSLPKTIDYEVRSPEFSFANSTWALCMYPNGQTEYGTEWYVDFKICRLLSTEPEQTVSIKIFLITRKGKQFEPFKSEHNFDPDYPCYIVKNFISCSELLAKRNVVAPQGTLTVVCQMRTKCATEAEAISQGNNIRAAIRNTENTCQNLSTAAQDKNLLNDLKKLLLSEDGCDVTLQVGGQNFQAHRAILRARSPVFASMLNHDMKEKNTGLIDIKDCDPEAFPDFLNFLYCGSVDSITLQNACSLYRAADKYDVEDLKRECLTFIQNNLAVDNFCDILALALQHTIASLLKQATDFFAKNMAKIIVTVKWQMFLSENPIESNELLIKAVGADKS